MLMAARGTGELTLRVCRLCSTYWDSTRTPRTSLWIQSGRSLTMCIPETTLLGQALRHYHSEQGHNWSLFRIRKIPSLLYPLVRLQPLQYVTMTLGRVVVLTPFYICSIKAASIINTIDLITTHHLRLLPAPRLLLIQQHHFLPLMQLILPQ